MKINTLIIKLESVLSKFLGIERKREVHLNSVEVHDNKLFIFINESYTRHRVIVDWEYFSKKDLLNLSAIKKFKLGMAIGKAIAPDLAVTINNTTVTTLDNTDANESK